MAVEVNGICCILIELKRRTKIEWNELKVSRWNWAKLFNIVNFEWIQRHTPFTIHYFLSKDYSLQTISMKSENTFYALMASMPISFSLFSSRCFLFSCESKEKPIYLTVKYPVIKLWNSQLNEVHWFSSQWISSHSHEKSRYRWIVILSFFNRLSLFFFQAETLSIVNGYIVNELWINRITV